MITNMVKVKKKRQTSKYTRKIPYIQGLHMNDAHTDIYNPIFKVKTNSMEFSLQANYIDRAAAADRQS
jgi:hypothetical protein